MSNLYETALALHQNQPATKPLMYYKKYDQFLTNHNLMPFTILEFGTFDGISTKILSKAFHNSTVLTLDVNKKHIDFSGFPNVIQAKANQINHAEVIPAIERVFPNGIDLVIDDASHFGWFSKLTFEMVFPLLRSGGAYFIEDWGTGYWDSWPDGNRYQSFVLTPHNNNIPKRIPSHDFGMVGFVKSLVDLTHETAIKNRQFDECNASSRISSLEFGEGVCMLLKAAI
jgi:hypothetical protein